MIKYAYVAGWQPQLDPQVAGTALAAIAEKEGVIKPETVVEQSRPKKAALHSYFEWDDGKAGEMYRTDQASKLIRCVRVVTEESQEAESVLHRPFIHINSTPTQEAGYYPSAFVMSHADMRNQAISDAISHLSRARERLKEYRELEREYSAIQAVEKRVQKKHTRLLADSGKSAHVSI